MNDTTERLEIPALVDDSTVEAQARRALVTGLRQLAYFLEAHPDVPCMPTSLGAWVYDKTKLQQIASGSGSWKKHYDGTLFRLVKTFVGDISLNIYAGRETVCQRVVVGTKEIPEVIVPAHTEEIVEWHCEGSGLLGQAEVSS